MKIFIILLLLIVIVFVMIFTLCFAKAASYADQAYEKMTIKKSADSGFKNSV